MFLNFLIANCLAFAANAHVIMTHPTPYGLYSLQNAPLEADGSNFPCKLREGVYNLEGASNVYAQGSTQHLAFRGSAVHGGGSCQVSLTTDIHPDKNSVWKVIKSIEGGCPAQGQVGNLGTDPDPSVVVPYTYNYTIPAQLPAGSYTLAWTWFNKIGNREMYMNCAPLNVTGYGGSKDYLNSLPDMFKANIPNKEGCTIQEETDVLFPSPGLIVEKLNGATDVFGLPNCTATTVPTGGYYSPPAPSLPLAPLIPLPPQATVAPIFVTAPGNSPTKSVGQPATARPLSSSTAKPAAPGTQTLPPVPKPAPTSSLKNPSGGTGPGVAYPAGTACTQEGMWNCVDGNAFQRCGSRVWSAVLPLAAGMKCNLGQAEEIRLVSRKSKFAFRHMLRSLSRTQIA